VGPEVEMETQLVLTKTASCARFNAQSNHMAETLDPLEISRTLSAVAWQADQVEQKLVGGDEN